MRVYVSHTKEKMCTRGASLLPSISLRCLNRKNEESFSFFLVKIKQVREKYTKYKYAFIKKGKKFKIPSAPFAPPEV